MMGVFKGLASILFGAIVIYSVLSLESTNWSLVGWIAGVVLIIFGLFSLFSRNRPKLR